MLSVRKKCGFQSRLTRMLADIIGEAMYDNELLASLVKQEGLGHQKLTSVLTGTVEGVRTPCRCWSYVPKRAEGRERHQMEEEAEQQGGRPKLRSVIDVEDFVLEVGMGEKTQFLSMLARSYIERGTLCVMTVKMERHSGHDFGWSYSLYRRGRLKCSSGQVTRYEVVCAAQDISVKRNKHGVVQFPAGLTLFDFLPASVLERHGVTRKNDKKALLDLSMSLEELGRVRSKAGLEIEPRNILATVFAETQRTVVNGCAFSMQPRFLLPLSNFFKTPSSLHAIPRVIDLAET